jgi:HAD superfamily hydrolase (TIGR01450 family)
LVGALALGIETLQRWDKRRILWLGVHHLDDYWRENGFELVREGPTDAVILGANPELQLHDLELALPALMDHGAEIVALHRNLFYLDREGHRRLGPGAWCAALEEIVGRDRAVCIGKPSARIYRKALARLGAEPEETMFVSDDPVADLAQAKKLGMQTAFVLSGKYADHAVLGRMDQEEWPDIIADRLADLGGGQGG